MFKKYDLSDRPEALWKADEADFTDDLGGRCVVIKRSTKHAISSQSDTGKSHTTFLVHVSVSGGVSVCLVYQHVTQFSFGDRKLPPYIMYQGARLWTASIPKNGFPGNRYNCTTSGWMDEPVFFDWFSNQSIC